MSYQKLQAVFYHPSQWYNENDNNSKGVKAMSNSWKEVKKRLLSDPEVKAEYDKLAPEYEKIEKQLRADLQKQQKKK